MKRLYFYIFILTLLMVGFSVDRASAITFYGSNGLLRVSSANNVFQGDLWASGNFSYNQGSFSLGTYKNGRGSLSLLYGLRHYAEVGISQVFYQDQAIFGPPGGGPLRFSIKGAWPTSAPSSVNIGAQLIGMIPVGSVDNVEHEPYYSDKPSIGGMVIATFDSNPVDLRRSKRVHINIGYIYHNDKRSYLNITGISPNEATQQILVGFAAQFPAGFTMFFAELTGEHFIAVNPNIKPAVAGVGPPDFFRLTPGFRHQLRRVFFQAGVDITVSKNGDFGPDGDFVTIYPKWKIFTSVQYRIFEGIPPTYRRGRSMRISGRSYYGYGRRGTTDARGIGPGVIQSLEERQELLDQVEQDLREIREERIKAQRELEELKETIDEEPNSP